MRRPLADKKWHSGKDGLQISLRLKGSREDMERKVLQEYATYNTRRLNTPSEDEMIDDIPKIER